MPATEPGWPREAATADKQTVDEHDRLQVPPDDPRYTLRRVWLTPEEEEGYYYGFANEGLWPLCHIAHTRPTFRASDWEYYNKVNARFADALVEEMAGEEHPVVLIQDYHFALLPRMMKERMPHARVAIFWHIPWPNPEAFGICPWQRGTAGWPAGRGPDRVSCSGALQQFSQYRRSRARSTSRLGTLCCQTQAITGRRCCRSPSACTFLDTAETPARQHCGRGTQCVARGTGDRSVLPRRGRRSSGLYQGYPRTLPGRGDVSGDSSALSGKVHLYPDRRTLAAVTFNAMPIFKKRLRPRPTVSMSVSSAANGGRSSF